MLTTESKIEDLKKRLTDTSQLEQQKEQIQTIKQLYDLGLRFKNYKPFCNVLSQLYEEEDIEKETEELINQEIGDILKRNDMEINLIPPKANWDLKRSIEEYLNVLEKKTMQSIAEILQAKIDLEESEDDESEGEESEDENEKMND